MLIVQPLAFKPLQETVPLPGTYKLQVNFPSLLTNYAIVLQL